MRDHYALQRDAVEAARNLMFDATHGGGDMSRLDAYREKLAAARFYGTDLTDLKEVEEHVAKLKSLKEEYDRTPDGQTESVCDKISAEEDWILERLPKFDARFKEFLSFAEIGPSPKREHDTMIVGTEIDPNSIVRLHLIGRFAWTHKNGAAVQAADYNGYRALTPSKELRFFLALRPGDSIIDSLDITDHIDNFMVFDRINYDTPASLHRWSSLEKKRAGDAAAFGSRQIWNGTLAGCIHQFMRKPDSQKRLYDIMTDASAGVGKTILEPDDIVRIASRPDFPKEAA